MGGKSVIKNGAKAIGMLHGILAQDICEDVKLENPETASAAQRRLHYEILPFAGEQMRHFNFRLCTSESFPTNNLYKRDLWIACDSTGACDTFINSSVTTIIWNQLRFLFSFRLFLGLPFLRFLWVRNDYRLQYCFCKWSVRDKYNLFYLNNQKLST